MLCFSNNSSYHHLKLEKIEETLKNKKRIWKKETHSGNLTGVEEIIHDEDSKLIISWRKGYEFTDEGYKVSFGLPDVYGEEEGFQYADLKNCMEQLVKTSIKKTILAASSFATFSTIGLITQSFIPILIGLAPTSYFSLSAISDTQINYTAKDSILMLIEKCNKSESINYLSNIYNI